MANLTFSQLVQELVTDGVVPADATATHCASIGYNGKPFSAGLQLTPSETRSAPTSLQWPAPAHSSSNSLYTIVCIDPDAPNRAKHRMRNVVHWLVCNLAAPQFNDASDGFTVAAYKGPGPPPGTGLHRYVFLIYQQSAPVTESPALTGQFVGLSGRGRWQVKQVEDMLAEHGAGQLTLIAATLFQAQADEYSIEHAKEQYGWKLPIMTLMVRLLT